MRVFRWWGIISQGWYAAIMEAELIRLEATAQLALRGEGRRRVQIYCNTMAGLTALQKATMEFLTL